MGGPLEVSVSGNNFESTLVALEQLTIGRDQNRGGIEVISQDEKSGSQSKLRGSVNIVGLKCVRHTFMSQGDKPNVLKTEATDKFLFNTVSAALDDVRDKLTKASDSNVKQQIIERIDDLRSGFENKIVGDKDLGFRQIPLSRDEIKGLVCTVRALQKMSVDQLLALNVDALGGLVADAEANILTERKNQMNELKELASFAKGKWEGKDGGEGYLCMLEDGGIAKFLTHSDERENFGKMDLSTLSESDKKMINDATARLKEKILNLADRCGGTLRKQVEDLLNAGEAKGDLSPFISRKTVAQIVSLLGEKIGLVDGKSFDWGDVTRADTVAYSGIGDVLPLDSVNPSDGAIKAWLSAEQKKELDWYNANKSKDTGKVSQDRIKDHLIERLKDETFTKQAARMLKAACNLKQAIDLGKIEANDNALRACSKNPFVSVVGSSSVVLDQMLKKYGEGKVAVQVFADGTHCGGGINTGGQEEGNIRDIAVELLAFLKGMGFTTPGMDMGTTKKMEAHIMYNIDDVSGKSKLSSAWGYLVNGAKRMTNHLMTSANGALQKVKYLFTAMPSFHHGYNKDENGSVDWICKCRKFVANQDLTADQIKHTRSVIKAIFDPNTPGYERLNALKATHALYDWGASDVQEKREAKARELNAKAPTQFSEMMMILEFGVFDDRDPKPFDVLKDSPEEIVGKLADLMEKGDYKELLDNAKANYEKTIRQSVKTWIKMLHDSGVKCLVSGAMGTGYFKNPSKFLARIVAEEFVNYGGDIKFVYANYGGNDEDAKVWEDAFAAAYGKKGETAPVNNVQTLEPFAPAEQNVNVELDVNSLGLEDEIGTPVSDNPLKSPSLGDLTKELRELMANAGGDGMSTRAKYAFVINAISTKSKYLKGIGEKTKTQYLSFLKSVKKTLSTKDASLDWIRRTLESRDLKLLDSDMLGDMSRALKVADPGFGAQGASKK